VLAYVDSVAIVFLPASILIFSVLDKRLPGRASPVYV